MTPRLEMIPTHGLRQVWPLIRERLAALATREMWIPEEVFAELVGSGTYLWTTPEAEGFVVLQIHQTPFERVLHCWIACNSSETPAADYLPQLCEIASENNCARVTWESDRRGWGRAIPEARVRFHFSVPVGGDDGRQEDNNDL